MFFEKQYHLPCKDYPMYFRYIKVVMIANHISNLI